MRLRGLYVDNIFDVGDLVVDEEYFRDIRWPNYATKAQWRMLPSQAMVRLYRGLGSGSVWPCRSGRS